MHVMRYMRPHAISVYCSLRGAYKQELTKYCRHFFCANAHAHYARALYVCTLLVLEQCNEHTHEEEAIESITAGTRGKKKTLSILNISNR